MRKGLASASDDGTIKLYYEDDFSNYFEANHRNIYLIVNNNGILKKNQKHTTLTVRSGTSAKGFSSVEFHPEGNKISFLPKLIPTFRVYSCGNKLG